MCGIILSGRYGDGGRICQSNQTRDSPSHFGFSPLKRDPVHAAFALASFSYPTSPSWLTDGTFGADPEAFLLSSVFCRGGNQPISRLAAPVGSAGFLLPSIRPDTADITDGQPESEGVHVDQLTGATQVVSDVWCFCLTIGHRSQLFHPDGKKVSWLQAGFMKGCLISSWGL